MPRMTNGVGTWFCKAHFDAGWGWDDVVECTMFVYFPIWPLRVLHLKETPGGSFAPNNYEAIPLRWSDQIVRHVFLRRWLSGAVGLGLVILLMLVLVTIWPPTGEAAKEWAWTKPILTPLAPILVIVGLIGIFLLRPFERRERDIRSLLGLHDLGTSDPASWEREDLVRMTRASDLFGTSTYAEAVPKLLAAGAWSGAMWSARLSSAMDKSNNGEDLTNDVLNHQGAREAISRFRRDVKCWPEVMGTQALLLYQSRVVRSTGEGTEDRSL